MSSYFVLFLSKKDSFTHCVCLKYPTKLRTKIPYEESWISIAMEGVFGFAERILDREIE